MNHTDTGHNGFSGADLKVSERPHMRAEDVPARVAVEIARLYNDGHEFIVIRASDLRARGAVKMFEDEKDAST